MKKTLLSFLMLIAAVPLWAYDFEDGGIYYNITDEANRYVEVTCENEEGSPCYFEVVEIPDSVEYNGIVYTVTSIGAHAFSGCSGLTSVTLGNSVTTIGSSAFYGCTGLTETVIPNSVTEIGQYAFLGCSGLTSVTLGNSVTTFGDSAFKRCSKILIVNSYNTTAPNGAPFDDAVKQTAILNVPSSALASYQSVDGWKDFVNIQEFAMEGYYDFEVNGIYYRIISVTDLTAEVVAKDGSYNSYSEEVVIPETVSYRNREFKVIRIGVLAFSQCTELSSVTIPRSVTTITQSAFNNCNALKKVTISDGEISLTTNGCFVGLPIETLYIGRSMDRSFTSYESLKDVTLGGYVTEVRGSAFSDCSGLTSVKIGNSVTKIWDSAFSGCTNLTEMTIPNSVTKIGAETFLGCSGLTSVTLGNSVTEIGPSAFSGCTGLTEIVIPNSVTKIWDSAFVGCIGLTEVTIPNSVTTIGASAFSGCSGLASVNIGDSVTTIGASAFSDCSVLASVNIGNSVTTIGASSFSGCTGLTEIVIPNSVTKIGTSSFSGCLLNSLIVMNGDATLDMDGNTFSESPLTALYIGRTMTNVTSPFREITTLQKVTLGSSMTSLQSDAFADCTSLKELVIEGGESFITIECTFSDSPIEKLHVGRNGTYAFNNRVDLKEVSIGDNVTSLPNNAFNGCSNIATLKLGNKLETIGSGAFTGCTTLMNVYSTNLTPPTGVVFEDKTYLNGTLYVVKGSKDAYAAADGWKEFWEIVDNLPFEVNGIWYNYDENGNANVVMNPSGDEYVGDINIPASIEVDGKVYSVTSIDAEAFANAINVTSVTIEDSDQPLTIGTPATAIVAMSNDNTSVFGGCMLDSVYVGRNLSYQDAPFANISTLKKVILGSKVTSMGGAMFAGCENIETVYAQGATPATEAEFESKVYDHATLVVPVGTLNLYSAADGWKEFFTIQDVNGNVGVEDIVVDEVENSAPAIMVANGEIIVNSGDDAQIAVYSINGGVIYQGVNRPVTVATKGVYVVVVNGKAMRVVI